MRKAIAKAVTWRLIGTAEIFAISFWTTGHIATAGHTAAMVAVSSLVMYVAHELAWSWRRRRIRLASAPFPRHAGEASGLPFSTTKVAAMTVFAGPFVPPWGAPVGT